MQAAHYNIPTSSKSYHLTKNINQLFEYLIDCLAFFYDVPRWLGDWVDVVACTEAFGGPFLQATYLIDRKIIQ